MGKSITHIGGVGDGQTAKVANPVIVGLTIEAVAVGLTLAKAAGTDPAKVRQALMGGVASSHILEVHGERMINETFDLGFRTRLHRKDIGLAMVVAWELDLFLPHSASLQQLMNSALAQGLSEKDHSALYKVIDQD
jgi:2-hydroxy-3-oxopropionate reductase